jgi:hypothetical protein
MELVEELYGIFDLGITIVAQRFDNDFFWDWEGELYGI